MCDVFFSQTKQEQDSDKDGKGETKSSNSGKESTSKTNGKEVESAGVRKESIESVNLLGDSSASLLPSVNLLTLPSCVAVKPTPYTDGRRIRKKKVLFFFYLTDLNCQVII